MKSVKLGRKLFTTGTRVKNFLTLVSEINDNRKTVSNTDSTPY